ncbi:MAG TPA: hypothetical protein PLL10_10635 [Elusimicrobiales bacterium]|nr:hypothetical protein [Elusimicrobiales bacterium]
MKAKLFMAAAALFVAGLVAGTGRAGFLLLLACVLLIGTGDWRALKEFGPKRFWLPLFVFVLLTPFFFGARDLSVLGRGYSGEQLLVGVGLLCNAYVFMTLVSYVSRNFSLNSIVSLTEKRFGRDFGLRIALVFASAGMIRRALGETWLLYSAERDRWRSVAELPVFMAAALRNTALKAEQIAVLFFIRNTRI